MVFLQGGYLDHVCSSGRGWGGGLGGAAAQIRGWVGGGGGLEPQTCRFAPFALACFACMASPFLLVLLELHFEGQKPLSNQGKRNKLLTVEI